MPFTSYAQNLEDVLLWRALKDIQNGFYVDVGANDPEEDSVTKAFYDAGWSGINIEPSKNYFQSLTRQRTRDINFNIAAGEKPGELTLYETPDRRGLGSFCQEIADMHAKAGIRIEKHTVTIMRLEDILKPYALKTIHFLKIDVEGFEEQVIRGMDFKSVRPWILVVEATIPNSQEPSHENWEHLLLSADYDFVYFDGLSRYYVAKERSDLKRHFAYPPCPFDDYKKHSDTKNESSLNIKIEKLSAEIKEAKTTIDNKESSLREQNKTFASQSASIQALSELLSQKQAALQTQAESLAQKDVTIQAQLKSLAEKDAALRDQADSLASMDAKIQAQLASLAEKDATLRDQADSLASMDAKIQAQLASLAEKDAAMRARSTEIARLRTLIYAKPATTHLYRAWKVLVRDPHYRQYPVTFKRYINLNVPWHTHVYRGTLALYHKSDKPWHTHFFRAWRSIKGDARYSPVSHRHTIAHTHRETIDAAKTATHHAPQASLIKNSRKKILQFTNFPIENPDHGGKMRCHSIREALRRHFEVQTLSIEVAGSDFSNRFAFGVNSANLYAKIGDGCLSDWGVAHQVIETPILWEALKKSVTDYAPEIILLEQPFLWPVVNRLLAEGVLPQNSFLINSSHNDEVFLKKGIYDKIFGEGRADDKLDIVRKLEIEATRRANLSIAVSEGDVAHLREIAPDGNILLYRNGHTGIGATTTRGVWRKKFETSTRNYVFIGSWHMPNILGLKRLLDAGLLNQDPSKIKLWVFGGAGPGLCSTYSIKLGSNSVIRCMGHASSDDIDSAILESAGVILPVWDGGGSNLKTAQALLSGRPVIASNFAFRGMEDHKNEPGVVVCETAEEMIEAMLNAAPACDYTRPFSFEKLHWNNLLKPLADDIAKAMGAPLRHYKLPCTLRYDLTTLARWKGHPTGIARVIANLGEAMVAACPEMKFVIYSPETGRFHDYDIATDEKGSKTNFSSDDLIFSAGANWDDKGYENAIEIAKTQGAQYSLLFYDAIPFVLPHSFGPGFPEMFLSWMEKSLRLTNLNFAISENSKKDVIRFAESASAPMAPTTVIRLGDAISSGKAAPSQAKLRATSPYILTVGTLEYRKNHIVLLNAYRLMIQNDAPVIPKLIIVGRKGWMDSDILFQIQHDSALREYIEVFSDITDAELDTLYRNCLFTVYPALYEGWGLPISESLGYGKLCIASRSSSMVEIAPELTPFADPLMPEEWAAHITRFAADPALLAQESQKIIARYRLTSWNDTASTVLDSISSHLLKNKKAN